MYFAKKNKLIKECLILQLNAILSSQKNKFLKEI